MKIGSYYDNLELFRKEKIVYAHFLKPHRVLSSCRYNGGLHENLEYLYNHQSCEPSNHVGIDLGQVATKEPERYQKRICSKAGLPHETSAGLGTAANINNAAVSHATFREFEAIAVTTAGVGTNGGRAGDPASYCQTKEGHESLGKPTPQAGTINIMLFFSEELTPGALVVASTVIAEAKASVLQELAAPSRYSDGIATGTGTDQIGIASLLGTCVRHTDANKHSKVGELTGRVVRESLQQALNLQSGLTPDARRSCIAHLQRFGETQETFIEGIRNDLPNEQCQTLFQNNFLSINHDPMAVAATQALVHLRDQIAWGVLPQSCIHEILLTYASQIAKLVSQKPMDTENFRNALGDSPVSIENGPFLNLIHKAFSLGFAQKWESRFED